MEPPADKDETNGESTAGDPKSLPQGEAIPPAQPPQGEDAGNTGGDKPKSRWRSDKRWRHPQVIVNGVLAAIGVAAAIIYYCELRQMQNATKWAGDGVRLAKESAELEQRAWVMIANVSGFPEEGKIFRPKIALGNSGRTFARDVEIAACSRPMAAGMLPDFEAEIRDSASKRKPSDISHLLISPHAISYSPIEPASDDPVPDEILQALKNRDLVLYLFGQVTYNDIFKQSHWLTFCITLNFSKRETENGGWTYNTYTKYNDTGDGAPPWKY